MRRQRPHGFHNPGGNLLPHRKIGLGPAHGNRRGRARCRKGPINDVSRWPRTQVGKSSGCGNGTLGLVSRTCERYDHVAPTLLTTLWSIWRSRRRSVRDGRTPWTQLREGVEAKAMAREDHPPTTAVQQITPIQPHLYVIRPNRASRGCHSPLECTPRPPEDHLLSTTACSPQPARTPAVASRAGSSPIAPAPKLCVARGVPLSIRRRMDLSGAAPGPFVTTGRARRPETLRQKRRGYSTTWSRTRGYADGDVQTPYAVRPPGRIHPDLRNGAPRRLGAEGPAARHEVTRSRPAVLLSPQRPPDTARFRSTAGHPAPPPRVRPCSTGEDGAGGPARPRRGRAGQRPVHAPSSPCAVNHAAQTAVQLPTWGSAAASPRPWAPWAYTCRSKGTR